MGRIDEDRVYVGQVSFSKMPIFPAGITDAMIASLAKIDQSKLGHQHRTDYKQAGTVVSATVPFFKAYGTTGTIIELATELLGACVGAATITIDLQRSTGGGAFASVLTGGTPITLNSSTVVRVATLGSIVTAGYVANDSYQLVIVATPGGGTVGSGLLVEMRVKEDAQ